MKEILTHSQISTYKNCHLRHHFRYDLGLIPKVKDKKLQLGSAIHYALAKFYKRESRLLVDAYKEWWKIELNKIKDNLLEDQLIEIEKEKELGWRMLQGYFSEYGTRDFNEYNILETEKVYMDIPIVNFRSNYRSRYFYYALKIDGLWQEKRNNNLWIVEHKTAKSWDEDINILALDEQVTSYLWGVQKAIGKKIQGILYNILRKVDPERARTQIYYRTRVYRNIEDLRKWEQELYDISREIRSNGIPYKNPSQECTWKCRYRNLCVMDTPEMRSLFDRTEEKHPELKEEEEEKDE